MSDLIYSEHDLLGLLDELVADRGGDWWSGFYADRSKPCPFFVTAPDETLVDWAGSGRLGAGRARKEDPVQAAAGVTWAAGVGDRVTAGQPLFALHTDTPERFDRAKESLADAVVIGPDAAATPPVVLERIV